MAPLRVLLADDFPSLLEAVSTMLAQEFNVVGALSSGREVLERAAELDPEVIVLDISLGDMTGFEVARILKSRGITAKIVFLTVHEGRDFIRAAAEAGALGYVVKSQAFDELREAIRAAGRGEKYFSPTAPGI